MKNAIAFERSRRPARFLWRVRNKLIEVMAAWGGRFLYKQHTLWLNDDRWLRDLDAQLQSVDHPQRLIDRDLLDRRYNLQQLTKLVRHLPGSTAECGVLGGHGSMIICGALQDTYGANEYHFACDSFEGLPEPTEEDRTVFGWHWWKKGEFAESKGESAQRALSPFSFVQLIKGWIPDCFNEIAACSFRFVHIDVDLYQPTKDSLAFFYPRLVSGGVILLDDHGFISCPGARKAAAEFFADKPEAIIETPVGPAFVIKH